MRGKSLLTASPVSTFYSMLRHPQVERQRLVAFQNDRLRRLIDHAFRNVTYYRALFDRHGLKPHDIRTVEDLAAAPITTKNDLQNLPVEEILARNIDAGRLITHISSGSSGQPFMVRRTWLEERLHGVLRFRALRSLGLRAGDKHGYVMRLRSHQRQDHQIVQGLLATFGIARQRVINALQSPEDIVEALHRFRPAVVWAIPAC